MGPMMNEPEIERNFVPTESAYGLFFGALVSVTLVATLWPYFGKKVKNYLRPTEEFATARNTQPWWSITCSFFSTSLGCWVLTAPAEIALEYSLWGIIGYAVATSFPWICVAVFGPRLRRLTSGRGFTSTDFIRVRLGIVNHIIYSVATFATVFLSYVVECISLSLTVQAISPNIRPVILTVSVALGVFLYTCVSGLQATLLTDRFQFTAISCLVIIASIGVFSQAVQDIPTELIRRRMQWTSPGFISLLVLTISCWYPTFLDPATWSRMYAAKSEREAKFGLFVAAVVLMIPMLLFGFMGLVAGAAFDAGLVDEQSLSVFSALTFLHPAWNGVVLVLATFLSTSTVDTMSSSFTTFVIAQCAAFKFTINVNYARVCTLVMTLVGLAIVIKNPPQVMTLFMSMNLICTCTAAGLLMSLWDLVTPTGVTAGVISGVLTVCTFGWSYYRSWNGGWDWWLLPEGSANQWALYTFIATGCVSSGVTLLWSQLEFAVDARAKQQQQERLALVGQQDEGREYLVGQESRSIDRSHRDLSRDDLTCHTIP